MVVVDAVAILWHVGHSASFLLVCNEVHYGNQLLCSGLDFCGARCGTHLFVGADACRAAEVELRPIQREGLAGAGAAVAVEAAALAAVHGQLPLVSPRDEAGVAAEFVQATLVGDLVLDRL